MDHSETFVPGMGYNPYQSPQESSNETKFDSKVQFNNLKHLQMQGLVESQLWVFCIQYQIMV